MESIIERAAGGFVVRIRHGEPEVLLIDDAYGKVAFPKGHVEALETWEDAAVREVTEETGIHADIISPLARVEYSIIRQGQPVRKQVRLFLMLARDDQHEPAHQAEEVAAAYFSPWDEAAMAHAEKGYQNWSFVFAKAKALWEWHVLELEEEWRGLSAATSASAIDEAWTKALPVTLDLVDAIGEELRTAAPDLPSLEMDRRRFSQVPRFIENEDESLRMAIEHTLLKPEASELDILTLCTEARTYRLRAVCVNPQHIQTVAQELSGTAVIPCVVVGFPLGAVNLEGLEAEVRAVVQGGAREVDMVVPVGSLREDDVWRTYEQVRRVCDAAHETSGVQVKVILEAHFLTYAQLAMGSILAMAAGADFLKTSTGFAPTGAKIADVVLMAGIAGDRGVKAAGGVRTRAEALQFLRFGATRIGTSSGVTLIGK